MEGEGIASRLLILSEGVGELAIQKYYYYSAVNQIVYTLYR